MHYAPIRSQLMTPFSELIIMQAYFTVRKGSFHPEGNIMIKKKDARSTHRPDLLFTGPRLLRP